MSACDLLVEFDHHFRTIEISLQEPDSVHADTTTEDVATSQSSPPAAKKTRASSAAVGKGDAGAEPSTSTAPDSSTEPDLESAMEMMKAALAAKQSNKPMVMDMFSKLMESVVWFLHLSVLLSAVTLFSSIIYDGSQG